MAVHVHTGISSRRVNTGIVFEGFADLTIFVKLMLGFDAIVYLDYDIVSLFFEELNECLVASETMYLLWEMGKGFFYSTFLALIFTIV